MTLAFRNRPRNKVWALCFLYLHEAHSESVKNIPREGSGPWLAVKKLFALTHVPHQPAWVWMLASACDCSLLDAG